MTRGKKWVRSHPFTTMALTIVPKSFDAKEYQSANLNTVLAWKAKKGLLEKTVKAKLPWHFNVRDRKLSEKLKTQLKKLYETYPGCTGWQVRDEPQTLIMPEVAKIIEWLRETYPETLVYSNALPAGAPSAGKYYGKDPGRAYPYSEYIADFINILKPDVAMFDAYIFKEGGSTSNLFPTLSTVRRAALKAGIPYWAFVQSYSDPRRKYRMPSESDIRMQVFMCLTYGYTGIAYFTYEDQQGPAMISHDRELRPIYYAIARLNSEVINLGKALRFLESTDVRYVPGNGNRVPGAAVAWKPGAGEGRYIKAVTINDTKRADWKDVLIGFFKDDRGGQYFMVTNLWHGQGASAAQSKLTVTLKFDPKIKVVGRLSRETGTPELLKVTDGMLQITLPGGTGDLFKPGDADFPGL